MKSPIDRLLDSVEWEELPPLTEQDRKEMDEYAPEELPYSTHRGVLKIGNAEFRVEKLNDGRRIVHPEDLERWFGFRKEMEAASHLEDRLGPHDKGFLQFVVGRKGDTIVVDWGKPVVWIGLGAEMARALANKLLKFADEIDKED